MLDEGSRPQFVFFVAAGAALSDVIVTFTNQETLEVQRRRPFFCQHSRGTMCWGITLLFGQLATNSGLLIFALDARNVTSSTRVLGHVVSINMGIQFVGLCFLALRSVLLLPLIMASLSWIFDATVTDVSHMLWLSFSPHSRECSVLPHCPNRHSEHIRSADPRRTAHSCRRPGADCVNCGQCGDVMVV